MKSFLPFWFPLLATILIGVSGIGNVAYFGSEERLGRAFSDTTLRKAIALAAERDTTVIMNEQAARMTWVGFGSAHLISCIFALAFVVWLYRNDPSGVLARKRKVILPLALFFLVAPLALFSTPCAQGLGVGLFSLARDFLTERVLFWLYMFDGVSLATALIVALGACFFMVPLNTGGKELEDQLAVREKNLQTLLYLSSFVLVTGLLSIFFMFAWAKSCIHPSFVFLRGSTGSLISSYVLTRGIHYSLVLIAVYSPAMISLPRQHRSVGLAAAPSTGSVGKELYKTIKMIVSLLTPLAIGIIGKMMQN